MGKTRIQSSTSSKKNPTKIVHKITKMTNPEKLILLLTLVTCLTILFGYLLWK